MLVHRSGYRKTVGGARMPIIRYLSKYYLTLSSPPDISTIIEMRRSQMQSRLSRWIDAVLTTTGQQLQLCCHRDVGNIPANMLRSPDRRPR
jgi:hypothetical protein